MEVIFKKIYLDTNIFIYILEGSSIYISAIRQLLQLIEQKILIAVTSELTLAEALVKPFAKNDLALQQVYRDTLTNSENLTMMPIDKNILLDAARLRANINSLRLADAIHAATAYQKQCQFFITNDNQLHTLNNLQIILLDKLNDFLSTITKSTETAFIH